MTMIHSNLDGSQDNSLLAELRANLESQRATAALKGGSPKIILPSDIKSEILDLIFLVSDRYSQACDELHEDRIYDILYDLIVGTRFDFTTALMDILFKDEDVREEIQETIGNLSLLNSKVNISEILFERFMATLDEIDKAICRELLLENWGIKGDIAYKPSKNTARSIAYRFKVSESTVSRRKKQLTQRLSFFITKQQKSN